ncbi:hypothetical protein D6745_02000 [Candidatus Woesearchaeota archaeon]|nr:MAG: hypothetical protein D6745_02000 [Candidatus Woesearchaeota archaeon]
MSSAQNLKAFVKSKVQLVLVLVCFLALQTVFLIKGSLLHWDAAVYVGMGKYIYTLGKAGLWEPIRGLLWPIILGFLWKIGLDPLLFGRIMQIIFSLASITLVYKIAELVLNKNKAFLSSILFGLSSIFFLNTTYLLVEPLTIMLVLLSIYFFVSKKYFLAGAFSSLAALTKFTAGIFLPVFIFALLFEKRKKIIISASPLFKVCAAFIAVQIPFLLLNYTLYKNPFLPFISANKVINNVVGCNVLHVKPWHYFFVLIIADNPFLLFSVAGIFYLIRAKNANKLLLVLSFIFPLAYHTLLTCKTERYSLLFLPFAAVLAAEGALSMIRNKQKLIISIITLLSFVFLVSSLLRFDAGTSEDHLQEYIKENNRKGEILTTTPFTTLYTDAKLTLIYYPLYGTELINDKIVYSSANSSNISFVFVNLNDIPCNPFDYQCPNKTEEFIKFLNETFDLVLQDNNSYLFESK